MKQYSKNVQCFTELLTAYWNELLVWLNLTPTLHAGISLHSLVTTLTCDQDLLSLNRIFDALNSAGHRPTLRQGPVSYIEV